MVFKLPKDAPVTGFDEFGEDACEHDDRENCKKKKKSKKLLRELKRRQDRLNKLN
jgi:hypothetical protein